jgi:hypothetical protein
MACHPVDKGAHQSAKQVGEHGTIRLAKNQQFAISAPTTEITQRLALEMVEK